MRILISPIGTFGDVAPMLAYANYLNKLGHEITFCSSEDWSNLILENNHKFISLPFDFKKFTFSNAKVIGKPFKSFHHFKNQLNEINTIIFDSLQDKIKNYDLVIGTGVQFAVFSLAKAYNIPYKHIMYAPVWINSRNHTPPLITKQSTNKLTNRLLWELFISGINSFMIKKINTQRKKLKLEKINSLYFSLKKHVIISSDYNIIKLQKKNISIKQVPYIYFEHKADLPSNVKTFLSSNKPTIYFGFGSMPSVQKMKLFEMIINVVNKLNCQAIIQKGWSNMYSETDFDNILFIKEKISHEKLFPKLDLIVHHGGAGTVHNAIKAGVVQLIIPHMLDQFYWGNIICNKKLGPKPMQLNKLSEKSLFKKINMALNNNDFKNNAKELSLKVKQENDLTEINKAIGL